jgi:hypothetical protein
MAKIVKVLDDLAVADVAWFPGGVVDASSLSNGQVQDGWTCYEEDVTIENFTPIWKQPTDSTNAYKLGDLVFYENKRWRSTITGNVWQPGVSGWIDASSDFPLWIQPTGAYDSYIKGAKVSYNGKIWESLIDANVWQPGVSGWRQSDYMPPSGVEVVPDWIQPTGAHDAYNIGNRVTHNSQIWISIVDSNVWEPGVYGWNLD